MKKKEQWRENLVEALEIPRDLALKESVFTVTGKSQIQIGNYRSILRYGATGTDHPDIFRQTGDPWERFENPVVYTGRDADRGDSVRNNPGTIEVFTKKLICFWKGCIKIQVRGEQTERFLNLCRGRTSASEIFAVILMEL